MVFACIHYELSIHTKESTDAELVSFCSKRGIYRNWVLGQHLFGWIKGNQAAWDYFFNCWNGRFILFVLNPEGRITEIKQRVFEEGAILMTCDRCGKKTHHIYITEDHEKVCKRTCNGEINTSTRKILPNRQSALPLAVQSFRKFLVDR